LLKREDPLPIAFHVHDDPATLRRFVEGLRKTADGDIAVICPFAFLVGVVNDEAEALA
jgi:hypothetical protein